MKKDKKFTPDIRFHKNRSSGAQDSSTALVDYVTKNNIKTLLFGGVSTDQCVHATVQGMSLKGFDSVVSKDGCGTISLSYATKMTVHNCGKSWGFVSSCEQLMYGVQNVAEG